MEKAQQSIYKKNKTPDSTLTYCQKSLYLHINMSEEIIFAYQQTHYRVDNTKHCKRETVL